MPAGADIVQSEVVGPSLGQEAIDSGMNSFLIATIFIFAWMVFYYGRAGIYADIALLVKYSPYLWGAIEYRCGTYLTGYRGYRAYYRYGG